MSDVRLVATNPEDSSVVPVAANNRGELLTVAPVIEKISNDVEIDGQLQVNGGLVDANGDPIGGGGGIALPPDPYEGAVLGWLNGGLSWIGAPPIEVPEGVFGPIMGWDPDSLLLTVRDDVPAEITTGAYVQQVDPNGDPFTAGCNTSMEWSSFWGEGIGIKNAAFYPPGPDNQPIWTPGSNAWWDWTIPDGGIPFDRIQIKFGTQNGGSTIQVNGTDISTGSKPDVWIVDEELLSSFGISSPFESLMLRTYYSGGTSKQSALYWIEVNGERLVDTSLSLRARVNNVAGNQMIVLPTSPVPFTEGMYLKVPAQRIAPWIARSGESMDEILAAL